MLHSALIIGCLCAIAQAADASPSDVERDVAALVERLDASTLQEREHAQRALLQLGPGALPYLPTTDGLSPEAALRVGAVRRTLELALARQQLGASNVTLDMQAQPLPVVLRAIAEQTGNHVECASPWLSKKRIDVNLQGVTFWEAIDGIARQAGAVPTTRDDPPSIVLVEESDEPRPAAVSLHGPFRFVLRNATVDANDAPRGGCSIVLNVRVMWEPRIRVIRMALPLSTIRAGADGSGPVVASSPKASLEIPVNASGDARDLRIVLRSDGPPPTDLREVVGQVSFVACGPTRRFLFAMPSPGERLEQRAGEVRVQLENLGRSTDRLGMRVQTRFDQGHDAFASHYTWFYRDPLHLVDSAGKEWAPVDTRLTRQDANGTRIDYFFPILLMGNDLRFSVDCPISLHATTTPFRWRDVPLAPSASAGK